MATDPGNNFASALNIRELTGKRSFSNSLSGSNKDDYYQFKLSNRSALSGVLNKLTNNADLILYDGNRQRLALSKNPGKQSDSINTILDAGIYYVRVNRRNDSPKYKLTLTASTPPDQAGNTTSAARSIAIGPTATTFKDAISPTDTNDFYRFNNPTFGNLSLNLTGLSADANVQLLNESGTVLKSSVAGDTTSESINAGLPAGNYFIRVFPGASGATTNYNLDLTLAPLKLFGLTDDSKLVSFNPGNSASAKSVGITGLNAGEKLLGIDFRPATGQLFGLGSSNRLYTIDPGTGAATRVSTAPFGTALSGTSFGFDFNPTVDRIRVVSDNEQNLRLNPDTGAIAGVDTALNPAGNVVGSAYTNNRAGATTTTLFGIDSVSDQLVRQGGVNGSPSPNGGALTAIGSLGVDFGSNVGFDIFTDAGGTDYGFAVSGSTLYGINLATGAATSLGAVSNGATPFNLVGLAARA